jgi:hypothetical protein
VLRDDFTRRAEERERYACLAGSRSGLCQAIPQKPNRFALFGNGALHLSGKSFALPAQRIASIHFVDEPVNQLVGMVSDFSRQAGFLVTIPVEEVDCILLRREAPDGLSGNPPLRAFVVEPNAGDLNTHGVRKQPRKFERHEWNLWPQYTRQVIAAIVSGRAPSNPPAASREE